MSSSGEKNAEVRTRGRPKGSGIDDRGALDAIKALLAADPRLKPTTAIKQVGVSNPSVVRRLRNKLAEGGVETIAASAVQAIAATRAKPTVAVEPQKRADEAALLAAYLEALRASAPPSTEKPAVPPLEPPAMPRPAFSSEPPPRPLPPEPPRAPQPPPSNPFSSMFPGFPLPGMPQMPSMPSFPGLPPFGGMPGMPGSSGGMPGMQMPGFSFPGFPSFMQPLQQRQQAPQPGTDAYRQLEAFKLAIEAMTAIARFQLHLVQNAAAYSPMALMLQGQSFMGQMLMASLTGQMDAMRPKAASPGGGQP